MWKHSKCAGALALAIGLAISGWAAPAAAQVATDLICSGCVGTNDLANGSIGDRKLKDDSVGDRKIKNGAIGQNKIKDDAIGQNKIKNNAIGRNKIKDNAVSAAKIADGAVTAAKLAEDAIFGRILVVRADPLDTAGNCDELLGVLAAITDNDVNNRYAILLEPGVYDCGATSVQMKPFVDIQGSGRESTLITGSRSGTNSGGVVRNAGNTELRNLSVRNTSSSVAVYVDQPDSRVTDVRAEVTGTPNAAYAFLVLNFSGTAVITNAEAKAGGAGSFSAGLFVAGFGVNAVLVDVVATAGPASSNSSGLQIAANATATARNSAFSGIDGGVISLSGGTANLVSSQLDGLVAVSGPGTFRCVGAYDGSFDPLDSDCDPTP